jgi:hypothetical protein
MLEKFPTVRRNIRISFSRLTFWLLHRFVYSRSESADSRAEDLRFYAYDASDRACQYFLKVTTEGQAAQPINSLCSNISDWGVGQLVTPTERRAILSEAINGTENSH